MTAEKDPRIEAVAKLLFTGPLFQYDEDDWDEEVHALSEQGGHRYQCLLAAEDVLRGIDEAAAVINSTAPWTGPIIRKAGYLGLLPGGAVIRTPGGRVFKRFSPEFDPYWEEVGGELSYYDAEIPLPLQVLWTDRPARKLISDQKLYTTEVNEIDTEPLP